MYLYKLFMYIYFNTHAFWTHICMCKVCVHCVQCIFFLSYSRLLTLRVCLGGDEERIERVQETSNGKKTERRERRQTGKEEWMTPYDQLCASAHVGC